MYSITSAQGSYRDLTGLECYHYSKAKIKNVLICNTRYVYSNFSSEI